MDRTQGVPKLLNRAPDTTYVPTLAANLAAVAGVRQVQTLWVFQPDGSRCGDRFAQRLAAAGPAHAARRQRTTDAHLFGFRRLPAAAVRLAGGG